MSEFTHTLFNVRTVSSYSNTPVFPSFRPPPLSVCLQECFVRPADDSGRECTAVPGANRQQAVLQTQQRAEQGSPHPHLGRAQASGQGIENQEIRRNYRPRKGEEVCWEGLCAVQGLCIVRRVATVGRHDRSMLGPRLGLVR